MIRLWPEFIDSSVFYTHEELLPVGMLTFLILILSLIKTWDFQKHKCLKAGQKWGLAEWFYFGYQNRLFTRMEKTKKIKQRQNHCSLLLLVLLLFDITLYVSR
jgi:hypothetical protein